MYPCIRRPILSLGCALLAVVGAGAQSPGGSEELGAPGPEHRTLEGLDIGNGRSRTNSNRYTTRRGFRSGKSTCRALRPRRGFGIPM